MDDDQLARIAGERVGVLASVRPGGTPHLVPVVFAVSGDTVVTPIDWKTKRPGRLQRLQNIEANPSVSLLVHGYSEDWTALWWVRVDGTATIHANGGVRDQAIEALTAKYTQYRDRPPGPEIIVVEPTAFTSWQSSR